MTAHMEPNTDTVVQHIQTLHSSTESINDGEVDGILGITEAGQRDGWVDDKWTAQFGQQQYTYEGTPYNYVRWFLQVLDPDETDVIYDLGCGYGRVVLYCALVTPSHCKGIEIVAERVREGENAAHRLQLKNVSFLIGNVLDFTMSDGTIFFLFNPFSEPILHQVLDRLREVSKDHPIYVVTWGGGNVELVREQSWLHDLTQESLAPSPFTHTIRIFSSL